MKRQRMPGIGRRFALIGTMALALVGTGCGDDPVATVPSTLPGTYVLRTVDDQPLPFVLDDRPAESYSLALVGGTVTLLGNGRYDDVMMYREVESGVTRDQSVATAGRWGPDGDVVMFVSEDERPQELATIAANGDLLYTFDYPSGRRVLRFERVGEAAARQVR